jgi:hypothetical protein
MAIDQIIFLCFSWCLIFIKSLIVQFAWALIIAEGCGGAAAARMCRLTFEVCCLTAQVIVFLLVLFITQTHWEPDVVLLAHQRLAADIESGRCAAN